MAVLVIKSVPPPPPPPAVRGIDIGRCTCIDRPEEEGRREVAIVAETLWSYKNNKNNSVIRANRHKNRFPKEEGKQMP